MKRLGHSRAASTTSVDLAAIIGAMPAAVVLLRDRRNIAEVSGRFASVFGRPVVDLLGSDLLRFVHPGDASLVGSVIHEARSAAPGSVPSSVTARFEHPDGSRRLVEVSAAHRPDGTTRGSTVVLLRPQTVRHGLNAALIPHVGWQDPDEPVEASESADDSLETIVGVLGCEPLAHECCFVLRGEEAGEPMRCPDSAELSGMPAGGPWDEILAGTEGAVDLELAALPGELQEFAQHKRFAALRCYPVLASHRDRVVACLVAWDHSDEPLSSADDATFRYAAEVASLALGRARGPAPAGLPPPAEPQAGSPPAEPWPSDVDLVTGLPLEDTLERSLDEMIQSGQRPGLIYVRLRALEGLRESLGAFTADQLIRVAARRVSSVIRMTDELYRSGSDGVVIVCTGSLDGDRLADIAERLRERLSVPFRVDSDSPVDVEAAVSYLESPEASITGRELLATVQGPLA